MTQMATMHSPDEIAYVKRLLDAMFEGNNSVEKEVMAVHAVQARALARVSGGGGGGHGDDGGRSGRDYHNDNGDTQFSWNQHNNSSSSNNSSLTQSQAEKVLEAMELEGWFEKSTVVMGGGSSRNERRKVIWYTLTPRALMELQQWLVDTYNHEEEAEENENEAEENEETHQKIKFCKACRQIVTMGQRCPKMTCNVRLHHDCVGKMFRAQRDHETCPTCKTEWQDAPLVGIEAVKEPVAAAAAGRRKSRNGTTAARNGGRRRSAASTVNGYDEEEEGEGEEEGDGEVDGELP